MRYCGAGFSEETVTHLRVRQRRRELRTTLEERSSQTSTNERKVLLAVFTRYSARSPSRLSRHRGRSAQKGRAGGEEERDLYRQIWRTVRLEKHGRSDMRLSRTELSWTRNCAADLSCSVLLLLLLHLHHHHRSLLQLLLLLGTLSSAPFPFRSLSFSFSGLLQVSSGKQKEKGSFSETGWGGERDQR